MTTITLPPIVLPEETYNPLKERLSVADFIKVMSRPFLREMTARLYRDACILRRAGFEEWECEMIIRARCTGYLRSIPDREFVWAGREASACCPPGSKPRIQVIKFSPITPEKTA